MILTIKNYTLFVLAIIIGAIIGGMANGYIISISDKVIPLPVGVDHKTIEGLKAGMLLCKPKHFIMPFLAHSIGTFVGGFLASFLAPIHRFRAAIIVSILFFIGGIYMVNMLPFAPSWFSTVDLVCAYLPMGILGYKLTMLIRGGK